MNRECLEEFILQFPIYQYSFMKSEDIEFSEKVRSFCKRSCPHYRESWSCPPAVGKLEQCRDKCLKYTDVLIFSTVTEVDEKEKNIRSGETQKEHEKLTGIINSKMRDLGYITYVISSGYCRICDKCTFPRDYCRHPEEMYPCIESHGIVVSDLIADNDMDYYMGEKLRLMFSLIFFKDTGFAFDSEKEESADV